MSNSKTDLSKYVVNVQGKDFITFPGLLAEAHSQGLVGIETSLINPEATKNPIVKALVTFKGEGPQNFKVFTGYGDATETNVAKKVAGALLRMAETRAIARALRFGCNIDMTAIEELDADDTNVKSSVVAPAKTFNRPTVQAVVAEPAKPTPVVAKPVEQPITRTEPTPPATITQPKPSFGRRAASTPTKVEPNFP